MEINTNKLEIYFRHLDGILGLIKILRYLLFNFFRKIKKRSSVYQVKELFNFFLKIFPSNLRLENSFPFILKNYFGVFSEILLTKVPLNLFGFFNEGKIFRKIFQDSSITSVNFFFLDCRFLYYFRELFYKNFVFFLANFSFKRPFCCSCFLNFSKQKVERCSNVTCFSSKIVKSFHFLSLLDIKFFNLEFLKKFIYSKNSIEFPLYKNKKFFFWRNFVFFLNILILKEKIFGIQKLFPYHKLSLKVKKKKFNANLFLKKINNYENFRKCLLKCKFLLFHGKGINRKIFSFKRQKNKISFLPNLKGHRIFFEFYQKNMNSFFELEKLRTKLTSFLFLKSFTDNIYSLENLNSLGLFIFRILNFLHLKRVETSQKLLFIEKMSKKNFSKNGFTYHRCKKTLFCLQKFSTCFKNVVLENENIHITYLRLTGIIYKLIRIFTKKNTNIIQIIKKPFSWKHQKNWELIFENRFDCYLLSILDSSDSDYKNNFSDYNDFNFRRAGL